VVVPDVKAVLADRCAAHQRADANIVVTATALTHKLLGKLLDRIACVLALSGEDLDLRQNLFVDAHLLSYLGFSSVLVNDLSQLVGEYGTKLVCLAKRQRFCIGIKALDDCRRDAHYTAPEWSYAPALSAQSANRFWDR
jgi:hypothetical protein